MAFWHQAIISTYAGLLLIGPWGRYLNEIIKIFIEDKALKTLKSVNSFSHLKRYAFHKVGNPLTPDLTSFWPMGKAASHPRPFCLGLYVTHDDVIKWKHFPRNWPFVRGIHRSPVNSPHKGQ